jgi:hypothetical protein
LFNLTKAKKKGSGYVLLIEFEKPSGCRVENTIFVSAVICSTDFYYGSFFKIKIKTCYPIIIAKGE